MTTQSTIMLNNDTVTPQVGLSVSQTPGGDTTVNAVQMVLENDYRHTDTAMIHHNGASVGEGIRRTSVPRSDFSLTTKLRNDDIRTCCGRDAFQESLDCSGVDYVDLYLIHWPTDGWQRVWGDLQKIYASDRAKVTGVNNFQKHHIGELLTHSDVVPAVDQVEFSPQFTNQEFIGQFRVKGIATEAWSPLGGTGGNLLDNPVPAGIGTKYGKSAAQVVTRWHVQHDIVVLPKSTHAERIKQNLEVFDFNLSVDDMTAISATNTGKHNGADLDNFNSQAFIGPDT